MFVFLAKHTEVEKANGPLLGYFEEFRRRCMNKSLLVSCIR